MDALATSCGGHLVPESCIFSAISDKSMGSVSHIDQISAQMPASCDETEKIGMKLAPFNPTNIDAIAIALDLLRLKDDGEVFYDLGCGDGRLLIEACNRTTSITGIGVEYDKSLVEKAVSRVSTSGHSEKVYIIHDNVLNIDLLTTDLSRSPTAIFIYLVPQAMKLLRDSLVSLISSGRCRVVTYVFSIPDFPATQVSVYKESTKFYLYDHRV